MEEPVPPVTDLTDHPPHPGDLPHRDGETQWDPSELLWQEPGNDKHLRDIDRVSITSRKWSSQVDIS